jgi:hypothetical protein
MGSELTFKYDSMMDQYEALRDGELVAIVRKNGISGKWLSEAVAPSNYMYKDGKTRQEAVEALFGD